MPIAVLDKPKVKTKARSQVAIRNTERVYAEIEQLEKEIEEKEIERELALSELDFVNGDVVTLEELKTSIEKNLVFNYDFQTSAKSNIKYCRIYR